jgi:argininosuccinate lyase
MNVEARLADLIGPAAGRLHTARSRNDQVAVDFKLWVRDTIDALDAQLADLQRALLRRRSPRRRGDARLHPPAIGAAGDLRPPPARLCRDVRQRDARPLSPMRARLNESPLGAAALAGTPFRSTAT